MTLVPVTVELLIGGQWVDVTADERVLTRDPITITRGRQNESALARSEAELSLRNKDGWLSPRNPMSPYYGLIGRNTPLRIHQSKTRTLDTFTRTETNGWGVNDLGQEYTTETGTSDFSVSGTFGLVSVPTVNVNRFAYVLGPADVDWTITVGGPPLATGADLKSGICARLLDVDNFYSCQLQFNPGATIYLEINKQVANVDTVIATDTTTGLTHVEGTAYRVRFQLLGSTLRGKCWLASETEPAAWNIETTDTDLAAPGGVGVRCRASTGNTNTMPLSFGFDDFTAPDARFYGEVSEWPPRWDLSGTDVYTPVVASGILRRLGQGASPLRSPLTRGTLATADLVAFWPMEEESGATQFNALLGGGPLTGVVFTPGGGSERGLDGSLPVATIGTGARLSASVTTLGAAGEWLIRAIVYVPTEPGVSSRLLEWHTTGTAQGWEVRVNPTGELLELRAFDSTNTQLFGDSAAYPASELYGSWFMIEVGATQDGADIDWHLLRRGADGVESGFTGTLTTDTAGVIHTVNLIGDSEFRCGHISVYEDNPGFFSTPVLADLMTGLSGESAVARVARLCQEEAVPLVVIGAAADSEPLGAQRVETLLQLLQDAADADGGILFEPRDCLAVGFRTRASLYNQTPRAELDYTNLSPTLEPTDDDQALRNDVTVQRYNGSEARAVLETGALSVLPPPAGVGRYDESVSLNIETDDRLGQVAAWRLHLGTWDEARYPRIPVLVPFVNAPGLATDLLNVDVGDVLTVDNPPAWLPPDLIEAMAQGYVETLGTHQHYLTFNCSPARVWTVFELDHASRGRVDTDGSTLNEDLDTTETSIEVAIASGYSLWKTTDLTGLELDIGGERMSVSAISGAASPQTFTVVRSVNGVVKTHSTGDPVHVWRPAVLAL